ncbi:MAG TPA: T9SS type A sorting domain-containing protein, partial [Segetibacter sp.]
LALAVKPIIITLKNKAVIPPVTVSCSAATSFTGMVGGLSIVRRVTVRDTASAFVQKVFHNEMFKTYPNPAVKGSSVNLVFKKAGNYSVQIFDNAGRLYLVKEFKKVDANKVQRIALPLAIGSGTYFIKALNYNAQKQFVDKLIIQ